MLISFDILQALNEVALETNSSDTKSNSSTLWVYSYALVVFYEAHRNQSAELKNLKNFRNTACHSDNFVGQAGLVDAATQDVWVFSKNPALQLKPLKECYERAEPLLKGVQNKINEQPKPGNNETLRKKY